MALMVRSVVVSVVLAASFYSASAMIKITADAMIDTARTARNFVPFAFIVRFPSCRSYIASDGGACTVRVVYGWLPNDLRIFSLIGILEESYVLLSIVLRRI